MVILTGMFRTSVACPVCGAPNMDCQREGPRATAARDTDFTLRSDGTIIMDARHRYRVETSRWRSLMDVIVQVGDRKFERQYAAGDAVPFLVALRQGQVLPSDVVEDVKESLRRHVDEGRIDLAEVKDMLLLAKKKKPKDRMVKEGQVVQKSMDDDAQGLLDGVA